MEKPRRNHQSLVWGTQTAGHTCYSGRYTVNLGKKVWPQVSKPVCSDPAVSLPGTYSQEESVEGYLIDHPLCAQMSSVRRLAKWVLGQTAMETVLWMWLIWCSVQRVTKKKSVSHMTSVSYKKGYISVGEKNCQNINSEYLCRWEWMGVKFSSLRVSEYSVFVIIIFMLCIIWPSLVAQTVKRLPTMRETWVRSLGQEDLLEKEMATHSSILAWKIPWMEEIGWLLSMGSQRVEHNWATSLSLSLCVIYMLCIILLSEKKFLWLLKHILQLAEFLRILWELVWYTIFYCIIR